MIPSFATTVIHSRPWVARALHFAGRHREDRWRLAWLRANRRLGTAL